MRTRSKGCSELGQVPKMFVGHRDEPRVKCVLGLVLIMCFFFSSYSHHQTRLALKQYVKRKVGKWWWRCRRLKAHACLSTRTYHAVNSGQPDTSGQAPGVCARSHPHGEGQPALLQGWKKQKRCLCSELTHLRDAANVSPLYTCITKRGNT